MITYRYSMLNTAHYCLEKVNLQYFQGIKSSELEYDYQVFGTGLHLALQSYFQDSDDPVNTFNMFWKALDCDKYVWGRYSYEELKTIGSELLRKWIKGHSKHYKPLHIEKELEFNVFGHKFTGKPDFVGYYQNKLSIVDWKTSFSQFDKRKAIADSQMWLYAEAVKQVYSLQVEQIVYAPFIKADARVQTPIVLEWTKEKAKNMLDNVSNTVLILNAARSYGVYPRNEQNCMKCPYFNYCYQENE